MFALSLKQYMQKGEKFFILYNYLFHNVVQYSRFYKDMWTYRPDNLPDMYHHFDTAQEYIATETTKL